MARVQSLFSVAAACLMAGQVWALPIQTIHSINEAREEFLKADQQTLVVFDVDETLLCYYSVGLFIAYDLGAIPEEDMPYALKMKDEFVSYLNKVGRERANALFNSFYLTKSSGELVEPAFVQTIHDLQVRGAKTVALTALPGGQFGSVRCGRTLRYDILKHHGIDFRSSFNSEFLVFDGLNAYNNEYPMFYKGILFASYKNNKGVVLGAFFDRIGWTPKKVLFFDDNNDRVKDVCNEMKKRSIPCQGYWYRGVDHCKKPPFNRAIAEVQLEHLVNHDTLLTAVEAKSAIEG
jgi:FMN phosphatase YigB (HAD superfamily)